jgi:hypothetical protein
VGEDGVVRSSKRAKYIGSSWDRAYEGDHCCLPILVVDDEVGALIGICDVSLWTLGGCRHTMVEAEDLLAEFVQVQGVFVADCLGCKSEVIDLLSHSGGAEVGCFQLIDGRFGSTAREEEVGLARDSGFIVVIIGEDVEHGAGGESSWFCFQESMKERSLITRGNGEGTLGKTDGFEGRGSVASGHCERDEERMATLLLDFFLLSWSGCR